MKKALWEIVYENFIEESNTPEIDNLNNQIDSKLKQLLPSDAFDEIYELSAQLQAKIEENGFRAGFEAALDR